jgi:hypothetical protein
MVQLAIFNATIYTNDQSGFDHARSKGNSITDVTIDNGECSYGFMYNVSATIQAMEKMTGQKVHIGAYNEEGVYISLDFMDNMASDNEMNFSWDNFDSGFEMALEKMLSSNEIKKERSLLDIALISFETFNVKIPNITVQQLCHLGKSLESSSEVTFNHELSEFHGKLKSSGLSVTFNLPQEIK